MTIFETTVKVRGFHEDRFGHVNNARYLEFLEEGRWDYLDHRGPHEGFQALGVFPVVANLSISYRRPAVAGDTLRISTHVAEAGSRKLVMHQEIHQVETGKLCCEADVGIVLVDAESGRPAVLGDGILHAWPDLHALRASEGPQDTVAS
jgi:thioesterase-3